MNIISWNLHKLHPGQGRDIPAMAREFLSLRASPFVAFILESTGRPDEAEELGDQFAHEMGSGSTLPTVKVVSVGGSSSRRENIIAISRGLDAPELEVLDTWKSDWTAQTDRLQNSRIEEERARSLRARDRYSFRSTTGDRVPSIEADPFPVADDIRAAAVFRCAHRGRRWTIGAVHSPGPGDGKHRGTPNAETYLKSVLTAMVDAGADVVLGDFNIYRDIQPPDGLREIFGLGNTTHGERVSRLDRIFVRPGLFGRSCKFNTINNQLSDHMGIALVETGVHPPETTTVASNPPGQARTPACTSCSKVHGWLPGLIRRWHVCGSCDNIYCPGCGYALAAGRGGNRTCACGGQTRLVS